MKSNLIKSTVRAGVYAGLLGLSSLASAATDTFQGVTFTANWMGNILTLGMNTSNLQGDWVGATHIEAIAINDTGPYSSPGSVTLDGPGSGADKFFGDIDASGLNANGCQKFGQTSPHPCWTGKASLGGQLDFAFTHTEFGANINPNPHLKVFFTDGSGKKVGSLYSENVGEVPLPAAAWLFASGLLGLVGVARKKAAQQT